MNRSEAGLLITLFFILVISACPSIYAGDSSLFAAASFSLGSAHPPGYPLYVILGKLFTFVPFGNVAFKLNLMSAFFGTLTCLMVFKTSMELTGNSSASWASALICGISPLFFSESLKAEVYTLNSFLAMTVFYSGLRMLTGGDFFKNSMLAFFLLGMGMGNHHTIGFMGLVFLWPVAARWRDITFRWIALVPVFFLAGVSINLFLYLRSQAIAGSGGLILYSYVGGLREFLDVFFRQAYHGASTSDTVGTILVPSVKNWFYGLKNSLYYIAYYSTRPVLPFLLIGLIGLIKKPKILTYFALSIAVWFVLLAGMVGTSSAALKAEDIQIVSVYFLPAIPVLYSLVSPGFASVIAFIRKRVLKTIPGFVPYAIAVLPFVLLPYSLKAFSLNGNFVSHDYGRDMLTPLPLKSLLMNYTDNAMFAAFYMRTVERLREDILVMSTAGKEDAYGLHSSPQWKYAGLYPDFYRKQNSTIKELNRDFALKGKLFTSNPLELTRAVSRAYSFYPYVFSAALQPKTLPQKGFKADIRDMFKHGYEKINYERVIEAPHSMEFMLNEIVAAYGFNTVIYADFIKRDGEEERGNEFYRRALLIGYPEKFSWPYINFLLEDGREKEAFTYIDGLGKTGVYRELAGFLKQKAVSAVKNGQDRVDTP